MPTKWNNMNEITEVTELIPGTPFAKKVRCRLCGEEIFSLADSADQAAIDAEMVRLTAHMAIQHEIHVEHHKCDDPNCVD